MPEGVTALGTVRAQEATTQTTPKSPITTSSYQIAELTAFRTERDDEPAAGCSAGVVPDVIWTATGNYLGTTYTQLFGIVSEACKTAAEDVPA